VIQIIALTGYAGSGKDTIAECLIDQGWHRLAFADRLKEMAWDIDPVVDWDEFGLPVYLQTYAAQEEPEVSMELAKKYSAFGRMFLQNLGQAVRDHIGPDTWVNMLERDAWEEHQVNGTEKFIITDLRYPNEVDWVEQNTLSSKNLIVRIERPGVGPVNSHVSDAGMDRLKWRTDFTLVNDGTPQEAADQILDYLQN
jgi:hypothetical protein